MIFNDVLEIKNGRNQRRVENPDGKYPVYGSGGIMGYADDYICSAETVIIGRKGSINNPIFVDEPFWNVDTAFGLEAKREVLIPRYLYYFCKHFDFKQLNKTVTIPSLTKSDLLKIEIKLPCLSNQQSIVHRLQSVEQIIDNYYQQLEKLDELVKARFIEMFGDSRINSKGFRTKKGSELFKISNGKAVANDKRFEDGIPAYGGNGISWYTDEVLYEQDTIVIGRVGFQSGNVHLVKGPVWITDNAMYISDFYDDSLCLVFLCEMMKQIDFTRLQDAGDLKKVTQKPFMKMDYILPSKQLQDEYVDFVKQVDKSKIAVQKALDQTQLLFDSLMQKYFG